MTLQQFLKAVGGKEESMIEFKGEEALEAVKRNGDALQYVNKNIFDIA